MNRENTILKSVVSSLVLKGKKKKKLLSPPFPVQTCRGYLIGSSKKKKNTKKEEISLSQIFLCINSTKKRDKNVSSRCDDERCVDSPRHLSLVLPPFTLIFCELLSSCKVARLNTRVCLGLCCLIDF